MRQQIAREGEDFPAVLNPKLGLPSCQWMLSFL